MPQRRLLLRVMLWSLGVGAVLGAMAILGGGSTVIWQISGTTMAAAVAAALMMVTSRVSEHKDGRMAGLVGMLLIVIEFLLVLILIWDVFPGLYGGRFTESLALTAFHLFACGVPAVIFLRLYHNAQAKLMAITGILLSIASFTILMIGCWAITGWDPQIKWYISALVVGGIGALLSFCLIGVRRGGPLPALLVRIGGALLAAFSMYVGLVGVWGNVEEDTGVFRIPLSLAIVIAHANLCFWAPLKAGQRWVRLVTVAMAAATVLFINVGLSFAPSENGELILRLSGASGLIAACGSLALVVLARMNRKMTDEAPVFSEIRELMIVCPGCQTKQNLAVGQAACPICRLRFHLRVEEPHCPQCDYLLFRLASDRCPECGTAV